MHIMINNVIGEKMINLSYPIRAGKEVPVISMLSNNVRYEVLTDCTIIDDISPGKKKQILSNTYASISILGGMVAFNHFVNDVRVIKTNKLRGIIEMILNVDELDNTDNLEDGRPSNELFTYHVTVNEDFTQLIQRLKNKEFTSLTLRIMDQNGNVITDGLQVTVVLHICDCKI